jgi:polyisoprenoid-binding protein YceI
MTAIIRMVLVCCLAAAPLAAQAPAERTVPNGNVREGTLSFDGRATTGAFTGTTTTVTGQMQGGRLADVRGWVEAPARTLTTGNQHRDRDLMKSMESEKYPVIRFELTGVTAPESAADSLNVELHGRFLIHGVTRDATVPASVVLSTGAVHVRGETALNLGDYDVRGLTKMLGMLKMDEHILVHVDLLFGSS